MADASLFNGQPNDTGSSCPGARLTSCTPSISKDKDWVSVENVHNANKASLYIRDAAMDNVIIHLTTSIKNPPTIPVTTEIIQ